MFSEEKKKEDIEKEETDNFPRRERSDRDLEDESGESNEDSTSADGSGSDERSSEDSVSDERVESIEDPGSQAGGIDDKDELICDNTDQPSIVMTTLTVNWKK